MDPEAVVKHLIADAICRYRIKKGENVSYTPFFCPDTYQSRFKVAKHLLDQNESDLLKESKDGTPNHFINVTGFQRLHNGAIWQQYEKHERLLEAVYDLAKEAVGEDTVAKKLLLRYWNGPSIQR